MIKARSSRAGFSLVEVALALAVTSFCLFTLLGLLSVGITTTKTTSSETVAVNLMDQVLNDIRAGYAVPPSGGTYAASPLYQFALPAAAAYTSSMVTGASSSPQTIYLAPDGSALGAPGTSLVAGGQEATPFRVTVGFAPQPSASGSQTVTVRVMVTWPALPTSVDSATAWPTKYSGSVETVAAIRTTPW